MAVSRASLLALDSDLGQGLDRPQRERASAVTVPIARVSAGDWQPVLSGGPGDLGLLVIDGLLVRETWYGDTCSAELLGSGDIVRPWQHDDHTLLATGVTWFVPEGARVALLDRHVNAALAQWPAISEELFGRAVHRAHTQAVLRATSQLRRLDHRTLLYLWHVGARFGRVTPTGVVMRLPLTHERLATLVGAHRPSFTTALRKLERNGLLVRGEDHEVVLTARARDCVEALRCAPAVRALNVGLPEASGV